MLANPFSRQTFHQSHLGPSLGPYTLEHTHHRTANAFAPEKNDQTYIPGSTSPAARRSARISSPTRDSLKNKHHLEKSLQLYMLTGSKKGQLPFPFQRLPNVHYTHTVMLKSKFWWQQNVQSSRPSRNGGSDILDRTRPRKARLSALKWKLDHEASSEFQVYATGA